MYGYVSNVLCSFSEDQIPLLTSEDYGCSHGYGMIVRPKDKLREEIKSAKKRRKEEKRQHLVEERSKESVDPYKLRARLEKLQTRSNTHHQDTMTDKRTEFVRPHVTFEKPAATGVVNDHTQKPTTTKYVVYLAHTHTHTCMKLCMSIAGFLDVKL